MSVRCPYCFAETYDGFAAFVCVGTCAETRDSVASAFAGREVASKPVSEVRPNPADRRPPQPTSAYCRHCRTQTDREVCFNCHQPFSPGWRECDVVCVAMAGARYSGKSVYIAVMKRQAEQLAVAMGGALGYLTPRIEHDFVERYESPLYVQRGLPKATAPMGTDDSFLEPLVFTFGRSASGRNRVLVVRDVAGEDLERVGESNTALNFLGDADGLFYLIDPLHLQSVRDRLHGFVATPGDFGGNPFSVLSKVIHHITGGSAGQSWTTPVAVILSKFDVLQELQFVDDPQWSGIMRNPGAAYRRDPSLDSSDYSEVDSEQLDLEVRSPLAVLNQHELLNLLRESFPTNRMFAVSALGQAPRDGGHSLHARGIAPFRCLDPLKWVLSRARWIDTLN